jgi:hypothetical protein
VGAAREQRRQNHQVPWREKPTFSLISNALGGVCDKAQPMTLREIVEMLGTNPRKVCHLGISEDLLARFDGYHGFNSSQFSAVLTFKNSDSIQRLRSPEDFLSSLCLWCEQPVLQKRPYKRDAQGKDNRQRRKHVGAGDA